MIGMIIKDENEFNGFAYRVGGLWEPLSVLVDGRSVVSAMIISFEEGVIAYWPEGIDEEAWEIAENIFFTRRHGLYVVIGGNKLKFKYLGICVFDKILLLVLHRIVHAERLAERLLSVLARLGIVNL